MWLSCFRAVTAHEELKRAARRELLVLNLEVLKRSACKFSSGCGARAEDKGEGEGEDEA